jgi:hypothetical protein
MEALHADLAREERAEPARAIEAKIDALEDERMLLEVEMAGW